MQNPTWSVTVLFKCFKLGRRKSNILRVFFFFFFKSHAEKRQQKIPHEAHPSDWPRDLNADDDDG